MSMPYALSLSDIRILADAIAARDAECRDRDAEIVLHIIAGHDVLQRVLGADAALVYAPSDAPSDPQADKQEIERLTWTLEAAQAIWNKREKVLLEAWDDLLEDMELHGMHDFEPYKKSKEAFLRMKQK